LVEGDDLGFLKHLHNALYPHSETPLDAVPNLSIGGWDGWPSAIGSNMAFKNAVGDSIATYCILDSDYHTAAEKDLRYSQAVKHGINLHIWNRKEIENYLLEPAVIARVIKARSKTSSPSPSEIETFLFNACEDEKENVLDAMATTIFNSNRALGLPGANKTARTELGKYWNDQKLHLVSGKAILTDLSTMAHEKYGVTIGAVTLARAFRANEIPEEVRSILACIQEANSFPATTD
jgi:hypothetical protein